MKTRMYYAETIEHLVSDIKDTYFQLMKEKLEEGDDEKAKEYQEGLVALGILEDEIFKLNPEKIEI